MNDGFSAWFRCSDGCDFRAELTEVVYRCPRCQGLLEVEHDLAALRRRSPEEWKALFDDRFRRGPWPLGSGVWGKKEWVYPQLSLESLEVPAYMDIGLLSGDTEACFRISTEKKGDFVLLSIEQVEETPKGDPSLS